MMCLQPLQPTGSENASAHGNGLFAGAGATPASRAVGPAESVGMPAPAGSVGMNVPQVLAAHSVMSSDIRSARTLNDTNLGMSESTIRWTSFHTH